MITKKNKLSKLLLVLKSLKKTTVNGIKKIDYKIKKIKKWFNKRPILKKRVLKITKLSILIAVIVYAGPRVARAVEPVADRLTGGQELYLERNIEARRELYALGEIKFLRDGNAVIRPGALNGHINRLYPVAFLAKKMTEMWKLTEVPVLSPLTKGVFIVGLTTSGGYIAYKAFKMYKEYQN